MDSLLGRNLTELYVLNRDMDSQLGALTALRATDRTSGAEGIPSLRHLDPETDYKVRRIVSRLNECVHLVANEPSLGLFRIQEHVHRTMPQLIERKLEVSRLAGKLEGTLYDLDLSLDVVDSLTQITHCTRIREALKRAMEIKQRLNERDEEARQQRELEAQKAQDANRSLSVNEPAEGYICPVCYYAMTSQDELIAHWQEKHNLGDCDNDVFQEAAVESGFSDDKDLTVIEVPVDVIEGMAYSRESSSSAVFPASEEREDSTLEPL